MYKGHRCEKECKSRSVIANPTQASGCRNPGKNFMTLEIFQVGRISVVILIRTDTTLDHSQEAEKVCRSLVVCAFTTHQESNGSVITRSLQRSVKQVG